LAAIVEDRLSLESLRALNFTEENGVRAARRRLADIALDVHERVTRSVDDVPVRDVRFKQTSSSAAPAK
jgi:hypothetical protein